MIDRIAPPSAPDLAQGGKVIYGAPLGILMLEARFPRIPGDMGNATTWPFPVLYRVVPGADPARVVLGGADGLLPDFIAAARELVDLGVEAITTNCGFLSIFQAEIAAAVGVPVATSAMMQLPWIQSMLPPGRRAGIVTVSAETLSARHLAAIGVPAETPIAGVDREGEFFRVIIEGTKADLDIAEAEAEVVAAARDLAVRHPDLAAVVLECTNMAPYAAAVQHALGLPVHDIYSMTCWFQAGLRPRVFS